MKEIFSFLSHTCISNSVSALLVSCLKEQWIGASVHLTSRPITCQSCDGGNPKFRIKCASGSAKIRFINYSKWRRKAESDIDINTSGTGLLAWREKTLAKIIENGRKL